MADKEAYGRMSTSNYIIESTLSQSWSPMLEGHIFRSDFQSELHYDAMHLLRAQEIESESSSRSDDVKIGFGRYALSVSVDGANFHGIPNLYKSFNADDFVDPDQLKQSVLRLLKTVLNMERTGRAPYENAIKSIVRERTGSSIKLYNSEETPDGVFLFETLPESDAERANWQEIVVELARVTNTAVLSIFRSRAVENRSIGLTAVVFHFPGLTDGYSTEKRNLIKPVDPSGSLFQEK